MIAIQTSTGKNCKAVDKKPTKPVTSLVTSNSGKRPIKNLAKATKGVKINSNNK